jgi:hypothetical protein
MDLRLVVTSEQDEDSGEAAAWLTMLGEEVSELDDVVVEQSAGLVPEGAKGMAVLAGLVVRAPADGVKMMLGLLQAWVIRTGRTVEATIDGDSIRITGASREQQDQVIGAWLGRHASST